MKLDDVKVVLQLAQESLKGVGFFPGVEAIASVPLKLIEYYEVSYETGTTCAFNELMFGS